VLRVRSANGDATRRTYILMQGLLPIAVVRHIASDKLRSTYAEQFVEAMTGNQATRLRSAALQELSSLVSKRHFLEERGLEIDERLPAAIQRRWTSHDWANLPPGARADLVLAASRQRSEVPWAFRYVDSYGASFSRSGVIETGSYGVEDGIIALLDSVYEEMWSLGNDVAYLGPLREEPRVTQGAWDERTKGLPVGVRGELSAEVLNRLQEERGFYHDWDGNQLFVPLLEAISKWSDYLGIGSSVSVTDHGKLGRGVQLNVGGTDRDLTAIGVGASQLLPVVLAVLTAPRGAVLCIEQPELHLHPAVQSRLADLLLFARNDVHCVIETHSEYLLMRARLRVAEGRVTPEMVDVLFVEQEHGVSTFEYLSVDDFGDLSRWPNGFFDTQEIESMRLISAINEKLNK